jgi:hypothetical protein
LGAERLFPILQYPENASGNWQGNSGNTLQTGSIVMNKRKKKQKGKAVNIENNSSSYCPILTALTQQTVTLNSIQKRHLVV